MPAGDPYRFRWEDLPDPQQFGFSIAVPEALIGKEDIRKYKPRESRWRDMGKVVRAEEVRGDLCDYLYSRSQAVPNGYRIFFFVPQFSDAYRTAPFEVVPTTVPHTWDPVLERLAFAEDWSLPQNARREGQVVEMPNIVSQVRYREALQENARATIRRYLSHAPWPAEELEHEKPIPTAVFWTHQGQQVGDFPACLHPAVKPTIDTYAAFLNPVWGAGTVGSFIAGATHGFAIDEQIPATNFTDWGDHIIDDRQEEIHPGVWLRTQVEVHPPIYIPASINR